MCRAGHREQGLTQDSGGAIDFNEEEEPEIMDDMDDAEGGEDPDVDDNIVVSGDANAAAAAKDKVKNSVDAEKGVILVKGAVPGAKGALVVIRTAAKLPQANAAAKGA